MTGKHFFRTQVYTVPVLERNKFKEGIYSRWTVELKHKFFSQPLNDAGYKLIHLGKWHVVGPNPDQEKDYPFQKNLKQPLNGSTHWIEKHKTEFKAYYPEGKGFHENVGGTGGVIRLAAMIKVTKQLLAATVRHLKIHLLMKMA